MAKLSTSARKKLPSREFAGPGRSFPVEDKAHARKALQLLPRSEKAGNVSPAAADRVRARANAKLGKSGDTMKKKMATGGITEDPNPELKNTMNAEKMAKGGMKKKKVKKMCSGGMAKGGMCSGHGSTYHGVGGTVCD